MRLLLLFCIISFGAAAQPIINEAPVQNVTLNIEADALSVTVSGELPDACTTIGDIEQIVTGDTVRITILTERPRDLMCAQVLAPYEITIPLETTSLPVTVIVNGVRVSSDPCPQADADHTVFRNPALGYCTRVPRTAQITGQYPGPIVISADDSTLVIASTDADGRTLDDILAGLQDQNADLDTAETTIGGNPALIVANLPGRTRNRQAFVLRGETLFRFVAQPIDPDLPEESERTDDLWQTVLDSWTFIPPEPAPDDETLTTVTPGDGFTVEIPASWRVEESNGVTALIPPETDTALVSIASVDEALAVLLDRYADDVQVETLDDRTVLTGVEGLCQQVILPRGEGGLWVISVAQAACGPPNSTVILNPIVQQMLR